MSNSPDNTRPVRAKAGTSKGAAAARRDAFIAAYLTNGRNATQAAITAGYAPKGAHVQGARLLKDAKVSAAIATHESKSAVSADLSIERWAKDSGSIGHARVGELYNPNGTFKSIHELPDHVQAAIASVEYGPTGLPTKIKFWDKNVALTNIGKHVGAFEKDNAQQSRPISLKVVLV